MTPKSIGDSIETLDDRVHAESLNKSDVLLAEVTTVDTGSAFNCVANVDFNYQESESIASELSQSRDPEHLLMAALVGQDPTDEAGVHAMTRALRSDPDNRLILWNFLQSCSQFPGASMCLDHKIEDHAIEVDGSNGQLWARIAGFRAQRGDMRGALDALNKAVVAPRFTNYRMEHIELFERGLAAAGSMPYGDRIIQAIGMQAGLISNYSYVMTACKSMAPESVEWASQCARLGDRLERDGRSVYSIVIGQSLQKNMYLLSGDNEKEALVAKRLDTTKQYMLNALSKDGEALLSRDDQVLANYMSTSAIYGEINAFTFLNNEVERLKNLAGYGPCRL